jgi:hypothetical protein
MTKDEQRLAKLRAWAEYCDAEDAYLKVCDMIPEYDHPDLWPLRARCDRAYEAWERIPDPDDPMNEGVDVGDRPSPEPEDIDLDNIPF